MSDLLQKQEHVSPEPQHELGRTVDLLKDRPQSPIPAPPVPEVPASPGPVQQSAEPAKSKTRIMTLADGRRIVAQFPSGKCFELDGPEVAIDELRSVDMEGRPVKVLTITREVLEQRIPGSPGGDAVWAFKDDARSFWPLSMLTQAMQQPTYPGPQPETRAEDGPRRVYRFESGNVYEHPSVGRNIRVNVRWSYAKDCWVDDAGVEVEMIETRTAPCPGARLNDDGTWTIPEQPLFPRKRISSAEEDLKIARTAIALSSACRCTPGHEDPSCTGGLGCRRNG